MSKDSYAARCIFILVRFSSLLILLIGIGVLTDGIYATVQSNAFHYHNTGVLIFGAVIIVTALLGYINRSYSSLLFLYLTVLLLIFFALAGLTFVMIFDPDYADNVGGETNANILKYSLLVASAVAMVGVLSACWYRSSLIRPILNPRQQTFGDEPGRVLLGPNDAIVEKAPGKPHPKLILSPKKQPSPIPLQKIPGNDNLTA